MKVIGKVGNERQTIKNESQGRKLNIRINHDQLSFYDGWRIDKEECQLHKLKAVRRQSTIHNARSDRENARSGLSNQCCTYVLSKENSPNEYDQQCYSAHIREISFPLKEYSR